jgi:oxygen-independent coproporphyrinogen-3 oxidase
MAGLYIHVPFCKQACHYCDFHFSTNQETRLDLVQAIARELTIQQKYVEDEPLNTIYFGGGTPSLLSQNELKIIFDSIHSNFVVNPEAEISLEANPDDLSEEKLQLLKEIGINRLSIGIQSFDDAILRYLNRAHSSQSAVECVASARKTGFENISLDLIYAIPGQDIAGWEKNIRQAIGLHPDHISSYSLTIEEKTTFGRWHAKGKLNTVDDDEAARQLEFLMDALENAGFDQYEVSNFGKPGFYSRHNSSYWKQEKYLGVGPSAHSFNGTSRQYNISNNHLYVKSISTGALPATKEELTREDSINEYLLTTLRTSWGSDLAWLLSNFEHNVQTENASYIETLESKRLVSLENNILKLTRTGRLLADKIASDLFLMKD